MTELTPEQRDRLADLFKPGQKPELSREAEIQTEARSPKGKSKAVSEEY